MFNRLKDRAKITDQDPTFKVRYIGYTETFTASGRGCSTAPVQRLWDNAEEERFLRRLKLKITHLGIHMKNLDKKKIPERLFRIENISFCNVDVVVNEKIFSWISREADDKMWECHAVFCSSPEKAKSMALVLTRAFHIAYKEWKDSQTREIRNIERYNRSQSLSTLSLEKKSKAKRVVTKQRSLDTETILQTTNGTHPPINGHMAKELDKRAESVETSVDANENSSAENHDQTFSDRSDISSLSKTSEIAVAAETEDLKL